MRRDLGADRQAARLGFAQQPHRAHARDVRHVVPGARALGQDQVARHDQVLGFARPTRQAEAGRHLTFVHLRARGEVVIFAVLREQQVEVARVLQRGAHHGGVHHAVPVIAHADGPGVAQVAHFAELLSLDVDRRGCDRM